MEKSQSLPGVSNTECIPFNIVKTRFTEETLLQDNTHFSTSYNMRLYYKTLYYVNSSARPIFYHGISGIFGLFLRQPQWQCVRENQAINTSEVAY